MKPARDTAPAAAGAPLFPSSPKSTPDPRPATRDPLRGYPGYPGYPHVVLFQVLQGEVVRAAVMLAGLTFSWIECTRE